MKDARRFFRVIPNSKLIIHLRAVPALFRKSGGLDWNIQAYFFQLNGRFAVCPGYDRAKMES